MSDQYLGEIKIVSFNFAPRGWAFCDGALVAINQNQALFAILGTTYGGNGVQTFGLPDLRGRSPVHFGNPGGGQAIGLGELGGEQSHTLNISEIPSHTHVPVGSSNPASGGPAGNLWAPHTSQDYNAAAPNAAMNPAGIGVTGQSQPHDNMSPYLVLYFVVALTGIFPSRN